MELIFPGLRYPCPVIYFKYGKGHTHVNFIPTAL
jgi:hypothetical protein